MLHAYALPSGSCDEHALAAFGPCMADRSACHIRGTVVAISEDIVHHGTGLDALVGQSG